MDPWFRRAPGLVTVLSSDLLLKVNLPKVDKDRWQTADLFLADNELRGQQFGIRIGLAERVHPEDVVLITNLKNLSVYYQKGSLRRSIREEPHYNLFLADNELRGQQFGIRIGLAERVHFRQIHFQQQQRSLSRVFLKMSCSSPT
jgi:hypothetical protein